MRIEVGTRAIVAVECFSENASSRRLAGASRAHEEVGLGNALFGDRIAKGLYNMILTKNLVEGQGSIFPREYLVSHGVTVGTGR